MTSQLRAVLNPIIVAPSILSADFGHLAEDACRNNARSKRFKSVIIRSATIDAFSGKSAMRVLNPNGRAPASSGPRRRTRLLPPTDSRLPVNHPREVRAIP
jgi:hypothetical protein